MVERLKPLASGLQKQLCKKCFFFRSLLFWMLREKQLDDAKKNEKIKLKKMRHHLADKLLLRICCCYYARVPI